MIFKYFIGEFINMRFHHTLRDIISRLQYCDDYTVVLDFDNRFTPCQGMSYRGMYSDIAFDYTTIGGKYEWRGDVYSSDDPRYSEESKYAIADGSSQTFREECERCLDTCFEGYHGGEFYMSGSPVWISRHGMCDQYAVMDILFKDSEKVIVICTEKLEV